MQVYEHSGLEYGLCMAWTGMKGCLKNRKACWYLKVTPFPHPIPTGPQSYSLSCELRHTRSPPTLRFRILSTTPLPSSLVSPLSLNIRISSPSAPSHTPAERLLLLRHLAAPPLPAAQPPLPAPSYALHSAPSGYTRPAQVARHKCLRVSRYDASDKRIRRKTRASDLE